MPPKREPTATATVGELELSKKRRQGELQKDHVGTDSSKQELEPPEL